MERYNNPLKINKDNAAKVADLEEKLKLKDNKIEELEIFKDNALHGIEKQNQDFEELRSEYNEALAKIEQLESDIASKRESLNDYDTLKKEVAGCISVPVTPLHLKCLRYLADRENRTRKRNDITPAAFYQFAIDEIFIKGNMFAIDSVPNHILRKFEEEIKNGQ